MKKALSIVATLFFINIAFAGPNWERVNYTQSTIFSATVQVGEKYAEAGDIVGLFVGDECRMIAEVFIHNGIAYVSSILHGTKTENAEVKLWVAATNKVIDGDQIITTQPEGEIHQYPLAFKSSSETTAITNKNSIAFTVAPTPFHDELTITSDKGITSIKLFNSIGSELKLDTPSSISETYDLSELGKGIYVLSVSFTDGSNTSKKIIKN